MPKILVKKKAEVIAEYRFNRKPIINIGSSKGNDIIIIDKNISEYHCAIMKKENGYVIKDKNTLTGTRVNDASITEQPLRYDDVVNIGLHSIVFRPGSKEEKSEDETGRTMVLPAKMYNLLGIYGKFEGRKYEVSPNGDTYIGRENISPKGIPNDIVLAGDMTASKGHAKISCKDIHCQITDVGSTGGIAVNGNKVGQLNDISINPGDEIAIGRTIFRFVEADREDYGVPKNHRIFLLKIRQSFIMAVNILIVGAAATLLYFGLNGIQILSSKPGKLDVDINRYWSPEENPVRTTPPDYDVSSSPAIGDIKNDGKNEIVYLNSSGLLFAWEGKKGSMVWKPVEIFNSGKTSPLLYDMNGDGIKDIVVLSDTSMLYIIDGATGGIIRREMLGGSVSENSPAVGDLDGDGKPDVVTVSEEGMVSFIYSAGYENGQKFTEYVDGPVYSSPVIIQAKNISPMVVIAANNGKVYFFDGKTRNKKTVDLTEKTGKAHLIAAAPCVGDLDGDGVPEVVVQSNVPQYVSAIDITRFEVRWTYFIEPVPPAGLKHNASPVIVDVDGDGLGDVVAVSANGSIYALKGNTKYPTGELLWKLDFPQPNRLLSSPGLINIDKKGIFALVFGTKDGSIYIVKNNPVRREMEVMANVKASNSPITSSVAVGDVKGDGKIDIVYSNMLNNVQILNTNIRDFKSAVTWPEFLGNNFRSGQVLNRRQITNYIIYSILGVFVLLILFIIRVALKKKKMSKRPRVAYL